MAYSEENLEQEFRMAARVGNTEKVRTCLDRGVDIETAPKRGLSALMLAVRGNHLETARHLLERGADPNLLHLFGDAEIEYVEAPAMILLLAEYGFLHSPALITAAGLGAEESLRALLQQGADIEETVNGTTALMAAASHGEAAAVKLLLQFGANARRRDSDGANALDYAIKGLAGLEAGNREQMPENEQALRKRYHTTIRLLNGNKPKNE